MSDALQLVLFLIAGGYAMVRRQNAPIAGSALLLAAVVGGALTLLSLYGAASWEGLRPVCWGVSGLCVGVILEKRSLALQRQVTALAQQLALAGAKETSRKDSALARSAKPEVGPECVGEKVA